MALYKGEQKLKAFKGDYKPVNIYKGNEKIAGWEYEEKTGESLAFEGTYNDSAYVKINGKTEEIGTGDKAPDNLYELKSVEPFDLVSVGKNLSPVSDLSIQGERRNSGNWANNLIVRNIPVVPGETYTVSFVRQQSNNLSGYVNSVVRFEQPTKTSANNHLQLWNQYGVDYSTSNGSSFTVPNGVYFVSFTFGNSYYHTDIGGDPWISISDFQLEKGVAPTYFVPFKGIQILDFPYALHSLPNGVCDYIDLVRGEGERRVMKLIFDGSEQWHGYANKSDIYIGFCSFIQPIIGTGGDGTDITRANWLPFNSYQVYNQLGNAFWVNTDGRVYISMERSIIGATPEETPEEARPKWLNFLASQPLIVMAERKVPEPFSIAPQMINTYYPYTQIYTISEIKPTLEGKVKSMGG